MRVPPPTLLSLFLLSLTAFSPVLAQDSSSSSSAASSAASSISSSLSIADRKNIWAADRAIRTKDFRRLADVYETEQKQEAEARERYDRKIAELRLLCRRDIRLANKDTKLPTILRCYRGEMSELRELLLKQRDAATTAPGVSESVRTETLTALTALLDAVNTVITAIDSNVYGSEADVREVKGNLREKYQLPAQEALALLRTETALSWISFLIERFDKAVADDGASNAERWARAQECLLTQEDALHVLLTKPKPEFLQEFPLALTQAKTCAASIRTIPIPKVVSSSSSSSVNYINRRTRRMQIEN